MFERRKLDCVVNRTNTLLCWIQALIERYIVCPVLSCSVLYGGVLYCLERWTGQGFKAIAHRGSYNPCIFPSIKSIDIFATITIAEWMKKCEAVCQTENTNPWAFSVVFYKRLGWHSSNMNAPVAYWMYV